MNEWAHHDGSALYVSSETPSLGESIRLRVRIIHGSPYTSVRLRSTEDAEFHMEPMRRISATRYEDWYEASLRVVNPVTWYRFMLTRDDGAFDWLTASGVARREIDDSSDFRITVFDAAPEWERSGAVYQIFPDRFSRSQRYEDLRKPEWAIRMPWGEAPLGHGYDTGRQWYGGDLKGVEDHLDHIADLGFSTIYLTPFFTAGSVHRYDASTFAHVDPLLGGDDALESLARAVHGRGMHLLGDLTLNHTGVGHEWFQAASHDPECPEREFYMWPHWPDDYVSWRGVRSLPKLDWRSDVLMDRMVRGPRSLAARWLGDSGLDGWRIDVANQVGRHGTVDVNHRVATAIRRTIDDSLDGQGVLIAEYMHQDPSADLRGDGWQAAMNYGGFSRPAWAWLCDPSCAIDYMESGIPLRRRSGRATVVSLRGAISRVPWKVAAAQWNILDSHDTARIATIVDDRDRLDAAVALQMTYPGVPMVFAGDEQGAVGETGEGARVCMDWGEDGRHDGGVGCVYRDLLQLRRAHPALTSGGMRWVLADDDVIAFVRETSDERLLVVVSRDAGTMAAIDAETLAADEGDGPIRVYGRGKLERRGDDWAVSFGRAGAGVWSLPQVSVPRW
ncbi:glycoside hydrolase family 13 protein [uncultured Bifidobacterium sp.]|uniref:glycoside hydrolase family 13 protein n=1 Tax=uncultured Bifidobacterium sp. TaxID=165187 RepID=UPI002602A8BA|nr:glycoside hydrolase family 13 protein [uncultured Bifidobacterium sp.]